MRRAHSILYVILFGLIAINYADRIALSIGVKDISAEFHLTSVQLGFLLSSFSWAYLAFLLPWGMVADRLGPRLVICVGLAIWSAATMVTGLAATLGSLFAARMVMGAAEGSSFPACGRIIRSWLPAGEFGIANMMLISGGYAGTAIGAIAFAWLISLFGWRGGFVVLGLSGFIWIVVAACFLRRPRAKPDAKRAAVEHKAGRYDALPEEPAAGFRGLLVSPSLWALLVTQSAIVYAHNLYLSWMPGYLQTTKALSTMTTGLLTSLPFAVSVVGSLAAALVSDCLVRRRPWEVGQRRWFVAAVMIVSATIGLLPFVDNIWVIVTILTLTTTGVSAATGLNSALLTDLLVSPADAGKAYGVFVFGANICGAVAPIVTGYVKAATGRFDAAWWFCGAFLLAGACSVVLGARAPIGERQALSAVPRALNP